MPGVGDRDMVATGEPFGAVVFAAMRGGATGAFGDFLTWHQLQYTIHTYNIYIYVYLYWIQCERNQKKFRTETEFVSKSLDISYTYTNT